MFICYTGTCAPSELIYMYIQFVSILYNKCFCEKTVELPGWGFSKQCKYSQWKVHAWCILKLLTLIVPE